MPHTRTLERRSSVSGIIANRQEATPYTAARILVDHLYTYRCAPIPGVDIGTAYALAEENVRVGGDLIDAYQFNNGSMAISIADIAGKGTTAAARAALVKYALRAYVSSGLTPAQVLRNLNVLYMETTTFDRRESDSFVSVFLAVIDPELQIITYASAGHDLAILLHPSKPFETLPPTAPIIGVFDESQKLFHQRLVHLQPGGSTLILATDGVTEACAPSGDFVKREDIMSLVQSNSARPAQQQADELLRATQSFCGGKPRDDIAILAARFP